MKRIWSDESEGCLITIDERGCLKVKGPAGMASVLITGRGAKSRGRYLGIEEATELLVAKTLCPKPAVYHALEERLR